MKALNPILALALLAPAGLIASAEVREEILVIVNNHIITRRDLNQAVEQQHAALYRQFAGKELDEKLKGAREKTLQGLVDAFILEDKAAEIGIVLTDDFMRSYVDDIKKQYNFATDADFEQPWSLKHGDRVLFTAPRGTVVRNHISHLVHHRGQLTVYLRLNDVPLPPIYGPTADARPW